MTRSSNERTDGANADGVSVTIDGFAELSAIRETLDAIRDDIAWWINNHRDDHWLPVQPIASMPLQSLAPGWADTVHPRTAAEPPPNANATRVAPATTSDAPRSSADGVDLETHFCCEAPELQWTGNPQFPGVACQNCGYIVADCGSVVMHPPPEADPDTAPKGQQRGLFAED